MAEQIYRYKAFISYRHVDPDRRWAKWQSMFSLETFPDAWSLVAPGVAMHIDGHLFQDDVIRPRPISPDQIEEAAEGEASI